MDDGRTPPSLLLPQQLDCVVAQMREGFQIVGYDWRYLFVNDGVAALARYDELGHVDLLLTDVVMPHMGGRELALELRARQPSLKVLYMSGYTGHALASQGRASDHLGPEHELLPKPFTVETLAARVRAVLDAPPRAADPPA